MNAYVSLKLTCKKKETPASDIFTAFVQVRGRMPCGGAEPYAATSHSVPLLPCELLFALGCTHTQFLSSLHSIFILDLRETKVMSENKIRLMEGQMFGTTKARRECEIVNKRATFKGLCKHEEEECR